MKKAWNDLVLAGNISEFGKLLNTNEHFLRMDWIQTYCKWLARWLPPKLTA